MIVQHQHEGYRLFLGQNPQRLDPGIHLRLPFLHSVTVVDKREGYIRIDSLDAYTKDNVPVSISGTLFYRVHEARRATFEVQNYLGSTAKLGTSVARSIIGNFDYEEINCDRNRINNHLKNDIGSQILGWGIDCTRFEIQDFAPQNNNVKRLLELQMEAERKRRENDLNTTAAVRTSEGLKASEILKSEGMLAAARNQAEANYVESLKQADAKKYAIEAEAEAKAIEIQRIASVLGGSHAEAANFILETRRIEQLKAIAQGNNNSSYFYPTQGGGALLPAVLSALDSSKSKQ